MPSPGDQPDVGDARVVMTTVGSEEEARVLGRALVEVGLVACAQLLPIRSLYRWQGELVDDVETLLLLKTTTARSAELMEAVRARHPYEVPEILELPATVGSPGYLRWMAEQTAGSG